MNALKSVARTQRVNAHLQVANKPLFANRNTNLKHVSFKSMKKCDAVSATSTLVADQEPLMQPIS